MISTTSTLESYHNLASLFGFKGHDVCMNTDSQEQSKNRPLWHLFLRDLLPPSEIEDHRLIPIGVEEVIFNPSEIFRELPMADNFWVKLENVGKDDLSFPYSTFVLSLFEEDPVDGNSPYFGIRIWTDSNWQTKFKPIRNYGFQGMTPRELSDRMMLAVIGLRYYSILKDE